MPEFRITEAAHNTILRQLDRMYPYDVFPGYNIPNGLVLAFSPEALHLKEELSAILEESRLPFVRFQQAEQTPEDCFAAGFEQYRQNRLGYILPDNALCCFVFIGGSAMTAASPADPMCRRFHLMPPEHSLPEAPAGDVTLRMLDSDDPARQIANLLFALLLDPDGMKQHNGLSVRADYHQAGKQYLALRMRNLLYLYLERSTTDEALRDKLDNLLSAAGAGIPRVPSYGDQPVSGKGFRRMSAAFPKPFLGIGALASKKTVSLGELSKMLYGEDAAEKLLEDYTLLAGQAVTNVTAQLWSKRQTDLLGEGSANLDARLFSVLQAMIADREDILRKSLQGINESLSSRRSVSYTDILCPGQVFGETESLFSSAAQAKEDLLLLHAFAGLASKTTNREFWAKRSAGILSLQSWHNFLSNYLLAGLREQRTGENADVKINWAMDPREICRSCFNIGDRWSAESLTKIYRSAPMPAGQAVRSALMVCDEQFSDSSDDPLDTAAMTHDASGRRPTVHFTDGFGPANALLIWFCA